MVVAGSATAVLAFAVGFGLAVGDDGGGAVEQVVAATTTTAEAPTTTVTATPPEPTTTEAPPTTAAPPTTEPPTTVESPATPSTVVVAAPPTTAAPGRLVAQYDHDSADRLVMERGGTASLTLTNVGGSLVSWLVQATGYVYLEGVTSGTLQPGQSVQVRLRGAPDVPPMAPQGHLVVTGGADGQFTIAVLVL